MYTVSDIENAVEEEYPNWMEFLEAVEDDEGAHLPELGDVYAKQVDDGGDRHPWVVFQVGEQYFEKNGAHDSWEGTSWDGALQEVESFQETITSWRRVKR
jgi:hypothetical protein